MISVNEVMSTELITLMPQDSVSKAAETMTNNNIRHIPIVDQNQHLVGIISQRDAAAACCPGTFFSTAAQADR